MVERKSERARERQAAQAEMVTMAYVIKCQRQVKPRDAYLHVPQNFLATLCRTESFKNEMLVTGDVTDDFVLITENFEESDQLLMR